VKLNPRDPAGARVPSSSSGLKNPENPGGRIFDLLIFYNRPSNEDFHTDKKPATRKATASLKSAPTACARGITSKNRVVSAKSVLPENGF
jgi:hypothetical protein